MNEYTVWACMCVGTSEGREFKTTGLHKHFQREVLFKTALLTTRDCFILLIISLSLIHTVCLSTGSVVCNMYFLSFLCA